MKLISHRGNLSGRIPKRENHPDFIQEAIDAGFDVEIDLRMEQNRLFLGHDLPQYEVTSDWLFMRSPRLWIHAKDFESLCFLNAERLSFYNYFAHTSDPYCLVRCGRVNPPSLIWLHDLTVKAPMTQCVIPLLDLSSVNSFFCRSNAVYGICSDYVTECKKKWAL